MLGREHEGFRGSGQVFTAGCGADNLGNPTCPLLLMIMIEVQNLSLWAADTSCR